MNQRILRATVELNTAKRNWKRVEDEAKREKQPVPAHLQDQHMSILRLCRGNLAAALETQEAMDRFPPLARHS